MMMYARFLQHSKALTVLCPLSACLSLFSFCCQTATPFLPRLRCLMAHVSIKALLFLSYSLIPPIPSFTNSHFHYICFVSPSPELESVSHVLLFGIDNQKTAAVFICLCLFVCFYKSHDHKFIVHKIGEKSK